MEILSLPVIEGIVITNLARKEYTVHAPPFSVRAACTFEEYVCDETKPAQRRVAAVAGPQPQRTEASLALMVEALRYLTLHLRRSDEIGGAYLPY